jgi:hypothetical protein
MRIAIKIVSTSIFMVMLSYAISITNDEPWLTVWFVLFIFLGVPLCLLVLRDLVVVTTPKCLGPSQILLHLCALFGAAIGYILGFMAVNTGHEKAHLHQLLVVILPLMVYATPLLMIFHGMPLSRVKEFYFK